MVEQIQLKDVCSKIGSGATPKGGASVYIEEGTSLIRSQNVYNLDFSYSGLAHINEEAAKKLNGVTIMQDDVLLNITGDSVARTCMVPDDVLPARVNQHVAIIRPDASIIRPRYLSYYLASPFMQRYMLNLALGKGASRSAITKGMIEKFTIPLIDIVKQDKIVDVLKAYDEAILNNNKRLKLIDNISGEIYKEWFVRFRYPGFEDDEKTDSEYGKIPSKFKIFKMGEIFEYYIGGGWGEEEFSSDFSSEAYVIRGTDFPKIQAGDWTTCPYRFHKKSNYSSRELKPLDIILEVSGGTEEWPVGRTLLVTEELLENLNNKVICASFCKQVRVNSELVSPYYFYYWMQFLYETRIIDRFQLQSTGISNFKFEYFLNKGTIVVPPSKLMKSFEEEIIPLLKMKESLARENYNLLKQRDMLLPRLLSGKTDIN